MSLAKRWAALGIFALLAYQILWHGILLPSENANRWLITFIFTVPLLPVCLLVFLKHRSFAFWGGAVALFYFSHGVMEAWTLRDVWPVGFGEALLSVWVIIAASWDGMKARFAKKPAA